MKKTMEVTITIKAIAFVEDPKGLIPYALKENIFKSFIERALNYKAPDYTVRVVSTKVETKCINLGE